MSKLYPPQIEGTIPAFYGDKIIVPFSMNRAVGKASVSGFTLKIKTVQNSMYVTEVVSKNFDFNTMQVIFTLSETQKKKLNVGQHYKLQLAYLDKDGYPGYYSTVGIVKYTVKPMVYIEGFKEVGTNNHANGYLGVFKSEDYTEKIYSSKFIILNSDNSTYLESDELIHNATEDTSIFEVTEYYEILNELPEGKPFYIVYQVTTNNNLVCASPQYKIMQKQTIDAEFYGEIKAELSYDEGYISISLKVEPNEQGFEEPVTGAFLLSRANIKTPTIWEQMCRFVFQSERASKEIFKDFTIEQGETYVYSLQQYNDNGLFSNRLLSNEIYSDFEDAFLFDGERQLKIRFNPQVSSFKNTILETKVDTIGNKHPFIFRNGNVKYKDFPISGLISYFMDEGQNFKNNHNFTLLKNLYREKTQNAADENIFQNIPTTNHTSNNIHEETKFKLDVLDWLSNGETKLFRSPVEGNYLVRLMNVSLSPNETVGRMLHTFNCNAYEVADCDYNSMLAYGIIELRDPQDSRMRFSTKQLQTWDENGKPVFFHGEILTNTKNPSQKYVASGLTISDMTPGSYFYLNLPDLEEGEPYWSEDVLASHKIVIGTTGSYSISIPDGITSIYVPEELNLTGSLTFNYNAVYPNSFSLISDVTITDVPLKQISGPSDNIMDQLEDLKTKIYNFAKITICKKDLETIYVDNDSFDGTSIFSWDKNSMDEKYMVKDFRENTIYFVRKQNHVEGEISHTPADETFHRNEEYYLKEHYNILYPLLGYIMKNNSGQMIFVKDSECKDLFKFTLNGNSFDLVAKEKYVAKDLKVNELSLSDGLYMYATYIQHNLSYYFEEEASSVMDAKLAYEFALEQYNQWFESDQPVAKLEEVTAILKTSYDNLLLELENAIAKYKEEHALD